MRILSLVLLVVGLMASSSSIFAGGKMKVPLTPENIEKCRAYFLKKGFNIPGNITGIHVTAQDWVCTSCGGKVEGLPADYPNEAAQCTNCGSPMEPNDLELYKSNPEGKLKLTDEQVDAVLTMGENWTCDHCGAGGNRDKINGEINKSCSNCGAPRVDTHKTETTVTGVETGEAVKKAVQAEREDRAERMKKLTLKDIFRMTITTTKGRIIGAGLVAAVGLGAVFTHYTLKDTPIAGEVTYSRWIQTVRVEQFQPVVERKPRSEIVEADPVMPVNGIGEKPGAKIIACDDAGVCLYDTFKWLEIDSKVARGTYDQAIPGNPNWAKLQVPADGRLTTNTRFDVDLTFKENGEEFSEEWHPDTFDEFREFKNKTKIHVKVDRYHNVTDVKVIDKEKK